MILIYAHVCYSYDMYQKLFSLQEEVFKVLASQKRLEIIQLLNNRELSVTQMVTMLGIPQANLSQHLASLRQARIVTSRRDGHIIYYRLSDMRVSAACDMIKDVLRDSHGLSQQDRDLLKDGEELYPIVKDVVCGMRISVSHASDSITYNGKEYYFCASGCKSAFSSHPERFVHQLTAQGTI